MFGVLVQVLNGTFRRTIAGVDLIRSDNQSRRPSGVRSNSSSSTNSLDTCLAAVVPVIYPRYARRRFHATDLTPLSWIVLNVRLKLCLICECRFTSNAIVALFEIWDIVKHWRMNSWIGSAPDAFAISSDSHAATTCAYDGVNRVMS